MPWRRRAGERSLTREGRIWTLWSVGIVVTFGLPAALLIWMEPLALPVSAIFLGHGIAVLHLQARRGARGVRPSGTMLGNCSRRPAWRCSAAGSERGWSARRARSWCAPVVTGCTASASGWARAGICRPATAWRTCCWRCARTRRASPRSPTGTSRARPGACAGSWPSLREPLFGQGGDLPRAAAGRVRRTHRLVAGASPGAAHLLVEDPHAVHELSPLRL